MISLILSSLWYNITIHILLLDHFAVRSWHRLQRCQSCGGVPGAKIHPKQRSFEVGVLSMLDVVYIYILYCHIVSRYVYTYGVYIYMYFYRHTYYIVRKYTMLGGCLSNNVLLQNARTPTTSAPNMARWCMSLWTHVELQERRGAPRRCWDKCEVLTLIIGLCWFLHIYNCTCR